MVSNMATDSEEGPLELEDLSGWRVNREEASLHRTLQKLQ